MAPVPDMDIRPSPCDDCSMAFYPQCKQCGYDLTGLADPGRCPECGNLFNLRRKLGVRPPETPEQRGDRLLARLRTIAMAIVGVLIIITGVGLTLAGAASYAAGVGAFFGAIVLLGAYTSYLYEENDNT